MDYTFTDYREQANLSVSELSRLANVDYKTARNADNGERIWRSKAVKLLSVINERLGTQLTPESLDMPVRVDR